jgi:hypothetical protein
VDAIDKIIIAAADYVQAHGWCRWQSEDSRGRVCISGALGRVSVPLYPLYGKAIKRIEDHHGVHLVSFNDYQCKSKRQALAFMRAAVKSNLEQAPPKRLVKQQQGRQ